jgi:hypothetical protein
MSNNTRRATRRGGGHSGDKENTADTEQILDENTNTQKEAQDSKRKFDELTNAVNGLKREIAGLQKKQLTEDAVQVLISGAFSTHTPAAAHMALPGTSTGGYTGLPQLQHDPHAKMTLEL